MAPMIRSADPHELDDEDHPGILTCVFVIENEPDADVPVDELAWWVECQERAETRAALAASGLL
jgi:hypothetical protein